MRTTGIHKIYPGCSDTLGCYCTPEVVQIAGWSYDLCFIRHGNYRFSEKGHEDTFRLKHEMKWVIINYLKSFQEEKSPVRRRVFREVYVVEYI